MDVRPEPHFLALNCIGANGVAVRFEAKAVQYSQYDGQVYWELRRFLLALNSGRKCIQPRELYRKQEQTLLAYFEDGGLDPDIHMLPSARGYRVSLAAGKPRLVDSEPFIRNERMVSTQGLLLALLAWCSLKKKKEDKSLGSAILECWVSALCDVQQCVDLDLPAIAPGAPGDCGYQQVSGTCRHHVMVPPLRNAGTARHDVVKYLIDISASCTVCPVNAHILRCILEPLAEAMAATLPTVAEQDALKRQHLQSHVRKMRIDEDYKHQVATRVRAGRARSGGDVTAVDSQMSRDTARGFAHLDIERLLAEQWNLYDGQQISGVVSIVEDAARLGNPAEETTVYAMWHERGQHGFWLVPQATSKQQKLPVFGRRRCFIRFCGFARPRPRTPP